MDEDRLSPRLGRLIDAAKAAARNAGAGVARAEGVALLTASDGIYVGYSQQGGEATQEASVAMALAAAEEAGSEEILAAAVAVPSDPAGTVPPSAGFCRLLAGVDPELQIVFKQRGRWVMLPLMDISPAE